MIMYFKIGENVKSFNLLQLFSKVKSEVISATTLRGFLAEKPKFARRVWDIIIDTRSIKEDADLEFLENFFTTAPRYISLDNVNFRAVSVAAGDFPVDWLENCKFLPQVKFSLLSAESSSAKLIGETVIV